MVIAIGILLGILCGIGTFFLIDRISIRNKKLPQQFRKEQQKVARGLVEKKNAIDKEFNEELRKIDPIVYGRSNHVETYAWKLENIKKYDKPIYIKGKLGLWNYEGE